MTLGEVLDRVIEPFDPARVRRRIAERIAVRAMRDYEVATSGRRTQNWRRPSSSADREGARAIEKSRNSGFDLVRNNKHAAAIDIQLTAHLVGDGIAASAVHEDPGVQARAQQEWDAFAGSKVDGRQDIYGVQKLACSGMVVGGESLIVWQPDAKGPDGRCKVLEGAFLDHTKNRDVAGSNLIVQGVEFDAAGDRIAYWIFDRHPGDIGFRANQSTRFEAAHVDHVYEERRAGQTRGISWLAPVATTLRDVADCADAQLVREKVAACLALVLTPGEAGTPTSPFDDTTSQAIPAPGEAKSPDTLRPGMVFRARPGETATVLNPNTSVGGAQLMKQELMGVSATTIPYHMLTGDPSEANYSSLRALTNPFHARLDDVQQNILVPFVAAPAFARRMRRLYLETGDKRFLEVKATYAFPVRRSNDPIKDSAGEQMDIRGGLKSMSKALSERGLKPADHLDEIAEFNRMADERGLAFDTDPRRLTDSGILQAAVGYIAGGANQGK
ncbi:phage portal protein [Phenylobacterium sp.]|uniref:phage portal protein n=1 Tax=Phenylobacterium sp. TaxID=1871053 RepID=UPI002734808C|nr:phage portal protein [Phenylobacterium sp.]MDP3853160.1 phage portal protein [Phenylobacterium sp.]